MKKMLLPARKPKIDLNEWRENHDRNNVHMSLAMQYIIGHGKNQKMHQKANTFRAQDEG